MLLIDKEKSMYRLDRLKNAFTTRVYQPLTFLIAHAVQLQIKAKTAPNMICVVSCDRAPMLQFVRKHMAPYLTAIEETRGCFKSLIQDSSQPTASVQTAGNLGDCISERISKIGK